MSKTTEWFAFLFLTLTLPQAVLAQRVQQRFTLGGYASTERYTDPNLESSTNDSAIFSGRAFLKVDEWGRSNWELVTDLRDKHDFFNKLDNERLHLTAKNEFQVRQMSLRRPGAQEFWAFQLGRFPMQEAGAVYVDGLQIEEHWTQSFKSSLFGGLNPKKQTQSYLESDPKALQAGLTLTYEAKGIGWDRNFYLTHALINQTYDGQTERRYLFHNLNYQWSADSRLITLVYLDSVPHTYVQTGNLVLQNGWSSYFSTELDLLSIDVIEYFRRQSVLEQLPPSSYKEGALQLNYKSSPFQKWLLKYSYGRREVDRTTRNEVDLGVSATQIWGGHWDFYFLVGNRTNFTSQGPLARTGIGYFSRKWESNLDLDYAIENNSDGNVYHPLSAEFSISNYLSKWTFLTLSVSRASNELVTISSAFIKIGYRIGNQEVPPIRDGAPPRGAL